MNISKEMVCLHQNVMKYFGYTFKTQGHCCNSCIVCSEKVIKKKFRLKILKYVNDELGGIEWKKSFVVSMYEVKLDNEPGYKIAKIKLSFMITFTIF